MWTLTEEESDKLWDTAFQEARNQGYGPLGARIWANGYVAGYKQGLVAARKKRVVEILLDAKLDVTKISKLMECSVEYVRQVAEES